MNTLINSPIRWHTTKSQRIRTLIDRQIALLPANETITLWPAQYDIVFKTVDPKYQHQHEQEMIYRNRRLVKGKRG